ncbi:hypothetical protein KFE25_009205 [Diacronema lutheri]|uniref:Ubiquitin thioesterase OTU n=2 Tax=Diacronema lutheri TaxID=2081491 RepID=A0A8J6CFJ9_DIALT|nr:hypothetical protein KFE25_009205 [Diacronema lutheri]
MSWTTTGREAGLAPRGLASTGAAPRSRIGAVAHPSSGVSDYARRPSVGLLPRTNASSAREADRIALLLARPAAPARAFRPLSAIPASAPSRFAAEHSASASGACMRESPRSSRAAAGSSSSSSSGGVAAARVAPLLSSTVPFSSAAPRLHATAGVLPCGGPADGGRQHSSLLPERGVGASAGALDSAASAYGWRPSALGASRVDRFSHSSAGSERRTVLPYGCTVVDGLPPAGDGTRRLGGGARKCDKCDGAHATHDCPHYPKERDRHPDALVRKPTGMGGEVSDGSVVLLTGARVRGQPGDGNCLFHSLAHGLSGVSSAHALRREVATFIECNGEMEIAGTPLHQWVRWDSGTTVGAYARRMASSGCWGGGIELAAVSKLKAVNVSVFEPAAGRAAGTFRRIGQFVHRGGGTAEVYVLYRGGVHYDALEGGTLRTVVPPTCARP